MRSGLRNVVLKFHVLNNRFLFSVDQQHSSGFQTTFENNIGWVYIIYTHLKLKKCTFKIWDQEPNPAEMLGFYCIGEVDNEEKLYLTNASYIALSFFVFQSTFNLNENQLCVNSVFGIPFIPLTK